MASAFPPPLDPRAHHVGPYTTNNTHQRRPVPVSPVSSSSDHGIGSPSPLSEHFYEASSTLDRHEPDTPPTWSVQRPHTSHQKAHLPGTYPPDPNPPPPPSEMATTAQPTTRWHTFETTSNPPTMHTVDPPAPRPVLVPVDGGPWTTDRTLHHVYAAMPSPPTDTTPPPAEGDPPPTPALTYTHLTHALQTTSLALSASIFWTETLFLAVWITPSPDSFSTAEKVMHSVAFLMGLFAPVYVAVIRHLGCEGVRVLLVDGVVAGAWVVLGVFGAMGLAAQGDGKNGGNGGDGGLFAADAVRVAVLFSAGVVGVLGWVCRGFARVGGMGV